MTTFLVDTNVPATNPKFQLEFPKDKLVICTQVLNELDNLKSINDVAGRNARAFIKVIEQAVLSKSKQIVLQHSESPLTGDDGILEVLSQNEAWTLLSNDRNMRLKALSRKMKVQEYSFKAEEYAGVTEFSLPPDQFAKFVTEKEMFAECKFPYEAQWIVEGATENGVLGFAIPGGNITLPDQRTRPVWGVMPKNFEQQIALWMLLNPDIKLVTITGKAGSGKTLLAIAAALHQTIDKAMYDKILISRPVISLGNQDIGFLPGSAHEKLAPWMQPFFDNIETLTHTEEDARGRKRPKMMSGEELIKEGILEIAPLAFMRGRSIPNQLILLDEAQNMSINELKAVLTRAGENTKIILTGDMDQVDVPASQSGLRRVIEAFKTSPIAAHISLQKTERSQLAEEAAERL